MNVSAVQLVPLFPQYFPPGRSRSWELSIFPFPRNGTAAEWGQEDPDEFGELRVSASLPTIFGRSCRHECGANFHGDGPGQRPRSLAG